ncbi:MAG: hypothetical protein RL033_991 [Pseudomonadota bacterium]|jgi:hypothetical protein
MKMRSLVLEVRFTVTPALLAVLAFGTACVEDVDPPVVDPSSSSAGSSGTGMQVAASGGSTGNGTGNNTGNGSGGSMSSPGAGGATAERADPTFAMGATCLPPMVPLLSDFTYAPAADAGAGAAPPTSVGFGDFTTTFSGVTYVYPNAGSYAVNSDVSGSNWHMSGTLGDYSGFGLTFNNCYLLNASAYQGISFTIRGNVPMGNTVTLNVGTAEDQISHVWLNNRMPPMTMEPTNAGRCVPRMGQYDGSCGSPTYAVPVTAEPTTINVTWAQLTGGSPAPTVNPAELTFIAWNFPPPVGAGTNSPTPYDVDLIIDDLRFIPAP